MDIIYREVLDSTTVQALACAACLISAVVSEDTSPFFVACCSDGFDGVLFLEVDGRRFGDECNMISDMTTQGIFQLAFVDGRTDDSISGETTTHQLHVVILRGRQRHGGEFQCS